MTYVTLYLFHKRLRTEIKLWLEFNDMLKSAFSLCNIIYQILFPIEKEESNPRRLSNYLIKSFYSLTISFVDVSINIVYNNVEMFMTTCETK